MCHQQRPCPCNMFGNRFIIIRKLRILLLGMFQVLKGYTHDSPAPLWGMASQKNTNWEISKMKKHGKHVKHTVYDIQFNIPKAFWDISKDVGTMQLDQTSWDPDAFCIFGFVWEAVLLNKYEWNMNSNDFSLRLQATTNHQALCTEHPTRHRHGPSQAFNARIGITTPRKELETLGKRLQWQTTTVVFKIVLVSFPPGGSETGEPSPISPHPQQINVDKWSLKSWQSHNIQLEVKPNSESAKNWIQNILLYERCWKIIKYKQTLKQSFDFKNWKIKFPVFQALDTGDLQALTSISDWSTDRLLPCGGKLSGVELPSFEHSYCNATVEKDSTTLSRFFVFPNKWEMFLWMPHKNTSHTQSKQ